MFIHVSFIIFWDIRHDTDMSVVISRIFRTCFKNQNQLYDLVLVCWKYWWINYILFFIRASKFCLSVAVLFVIFVIFVLISPTEPCNTTKKNIRLSTIKIHYFISLIFFLSSSARRQPLGGVLQKIGSATVLKPIKKYLW